MKNVVVWIDSRSAHIFELAPTGIVKGKIKKIPVIITHDIKMISTEIVI